MRAQTRGRVIWHEAGVLPTQLRMKRCPKAAAGQQLWEQWGMGGAGAEGGRDIPTGAAAYEKS